MYVMPSPLSAASKHTNAVKCTLMYAHTHTLAHCDQYNTRINAALIHVIFFFFFVVREKFCTLFVGEKIGD